MSNDLNKITRDIYQEILEIEFSNGYLNNNITVESITPNYRDIISISNNNPPMINYQTDSRWGNYVPFMREYVKYLEEINSDRDEEDKYSGVYIIKGEILENGEFIYDKPIRSNHYNSDIDET